MKPAALLAAACLLALAGAPSHGGSFDLGATGGGPVQLPLLQSWKAAKFGSTLQQRYDFSCGSAALATLLAFQYGHAVDEKQVFEQMYAVGDQPKIRREGFSLLDMKRLLKSLGYDGDGFEVPLDKLAEQGVPAIALVNENGYNHFVVVKGLQRGRVLVGDPATGMRALPRARFESMWQSRVLFVIHSHRERAAFNLDADWRRAPLAPLGSGLPRESLADVTLPRLGPGEF